MLNSRAWTLSASLMLTTFAAFGVVTPALAQVRAGVVTALEGTATVTRVSLGQPVPLARRDAVFLRDRIATRERSLAQLLLGGKALVTVREWSILTLNEIPRTATVELGLGRLAVAVAKDKMQLGDMVEIKTPNCVVAIRGTVVVADVTKEVALSGTTSDSFTTTITVLRGVVEVTQLDPQLGQPIGTPVTVGPLGRVEARGTAPLRSQTITPQAAQKLGADFRTEVKDRPAVSPPAVVHHQIDEALREAIEIAPPQGPKGAVKAPEDSALSSTRRGAASLGAASTAIAPLGAPSALPTAIGSTGANTLGTATSTLSALPAPVGTGGHALPSSPAIAPILPTTLRTVLPLK